MKTKLVLLWIFLSSVVSVSAQRAKAVILVYLDGGPAQTDTFDPKPKASRDIYGNYAAVCTTSSPAIVLGEKLPLLAQQADKFSLVRSLTHGSNAHETGHYSMITGDLTQGGLVYPSYGAVISYKRQHQYNGVLPPYISLTSANSRFNEGGFLGNRYKSFDTGGTPERGQFQVEGVFNNWIDEERLSQRLALLDAFEQKGVLKQELDSLRSLNLDFVYGPSRAVFDLTQEPDSVRQRYGMTRLGQSCLAARRLIESGVLFVNVRTTGWDTHKKHFQHMQRMLPDLDKALSALLEDLSRLGLLEETIVLCGGEFGRTPRVQWEAPWNGGRGHFGKAFSYLVAGGGFKAGEVLGETDRFGEKVVKRPVYPADLIGTVYALLGINPYGSLPHQQFGAVPMLPSLSHSDQSNGLLQELVDIKIPYKRSSK